MKRRRVGIVHDERYLWHRSRMEYGPDFEGDPQLEEPAPRRRTLQMRYAKAGLCRSRRATTRRGTPVLRGGDRRRNAGRRERVANFGAFADGVGGQAFADHQRDAIDRARHAAEMEPRP